MILIEHIQNKIEVILFKIENRIKRLFNLSCRPCGHYSRYNEECSSKYFCDNGYCDHGISCQKRPPVTYLYYIIICTYNWIISYFYCKIKGYTPSKFKIK